MTGEEMLHSTARLVADRRNSYGDPAVSMAAIAARWSVTCPGGALPDRPEASSARA
jgi:hypothetical protein